MKLKNEKGAVTLFVLVSCLFFLTSVACVNMYISSKQSAVNKEYKQIKSNYEKDLSEKTITSIYNNLKNRNNIVSFGKPQKSYKNKELFVPITLNGLSLDVKTIKYGWFYNQNNLNPETDSSLLTQISPWSYVEKEKENVNLNLNVQAQTACTNDGFYYLCFMLDDKPYWTNGIKSTKIQIQVGNTVQEITEDTNLENIYGKKVINYATGGTYRIFYIDFAGDFGELGTVYLKADYNSSNEMSLSTYNSYQPKDTSILEKMNPKWAVNRLRYKDSLSNSDKWQENEHIVSYLCEPTSSNSEETHWSNYFDGSKADYVIASPSVEMYIASYNQVSHTIGANHFEAEYCNSPALGYFLSINGAPAERSYTGTDTLDYSTVYKNMYCGVNGEKAGDWVLSSPCAAQSVSFLYIRGGRGSFNDSDYDNYDNYGICPLVSLKSNFIPEIDLRVNIQIGNTVTAITPDSNLDDIYGQVVTNYAKNGDSNTYRIFYIDFAGDFGPKGTIYLKADYNNNNIINLDNRGADVYTPISTNVLANMNPDWWANRGTSSSSWNINEHSVAYLCDPTTSNASSNQAWINFFNSQNADYVIGSPSLEMLIKSHKQVSHTTGSNSLSSSYRLTNAPGYIYHDGIGSSDYDYYTLDSTVDNSGYSNMYSPTGYLYYWLASPSSKSISSICNLGAGSLDSDVPDSDLPVCPVVALKTSFVPTISNATVTFNVDGSTIATNYTTIGGTVGTLPTEPTKEGYTFDGWYNAQSGGTQYTANSTVSSADLTLYAQYIQNQQYRLSFFLDSSSYFTLKINGVELDSSVLVSGNVITFEKNDQFYIYASNLASPNWHRTIYIW